MSNAILYRMPSGVPGDISRRAQSIAEAAQLDSTKPFSEYGLFGKMSSGKFVPLEANDSAAVIAGPLVRAYPTQTANANGTGVTSGAMADRLRFGFMTVKNRAGTPAIEGQVYTRVANATSDKPLGDIEATFSTAVTGTAGGGNTGNGTIGTLTATAAALAGVYTVTMTGATTFTVSDPNGNALKAGATGAAYSANGIGFTITAGGTAFVAGDTFTVTNAPNVVAVPGCTFKDAGDASGNVEIEYNIA